MLKSSVCIKNANFPSVAFKVLIVKAELSKAFPNESRRVTVQSPHIDEDTLEERIGRLTVYAGCLTYNVKVPSIIEGLACNTALSQ